MAAEDLPIPAKVQSVLEKIHIVPKISEELGKDINSLQI